mmetsp:Transcript_102382/g.293093  ORF Transcript_102382/g.293093 Transcript_102382/m.293093 type:complete len:119 (+) Transcript_102382:451-807(+)
MTVANSMSLDQLKADIASLPSPSAPTCVDAKVDAVPMAAAEVISAVAEVSEIPSPLASVEIEGEAAAEAELDKGKGKSKAALQAEIAAAQAQLEALQAQMCGMSDEEGEGTTEGEAQC